MQHIVEFAFSSFQKWGHIDPNRSGIGLKNSISYSTCRYSFVIASVGFNIDCVTTQHTRKYVENCADNKLSKNCLSNYYQIFCKLGYTCNSENSVFFSTVD